jgi:hypothetical protein
MASARKVKVERIVEEEGIELHLTMAEARSLYAISMKVGGTPDPERCLRGHIDNIRQAIAKAVNGGEGSVYSVAEEWAQPEYSCVQGGTGIIAKDYDRDEA